MGGPECPAHRKVAAPWVSVRTGPSLWAVPGKGMDLRGPRDRVSEARGAAVAGRWGSTP